jgi:hypothetical protein
LQIIRKCKPWLLPDYNKHYLNCLVLKAKSATMFSFLKKDPVKQLENKRKKLLEEAMHIQRSGDLKLYAVKMEAIDKLEKEIEALRK